MADWLLEPLRYGFVVRGLIAGLLAGLACGALSAFVVWRRLAFAGDAIAHSILPGVVLAFAFGLDLLFGAAIAALVAVIAIGLVSGHATLGEDTAIGVVFAGLFALGMLLMSRVASPQDLNHVLFGNILSVGVADLVAMGTVVVVVIAALTAFRKELVTTSFDPTHAVAISLSPALVRYGLLSAVALTTVVAVKTVGIVLVIALLVTPAAAASLLSKRLARVVQLSVLFTIIATLVGFYASYYADWSSGPAVVLVLTGCFVLAVLLRWTRRARTVTTR